MYTYIYIYIHIDSGMLNVESLYRAVILVPIPLPEQVIEASSCAILLYKFVLQTVLGMGMGMNVTAHV